MRRTVPGSLAFAVALLVAAPAARADQWSKTFTVSAMPHLALEADNASLSISPGADGHVAVVVTTSGWQIPKDVHVIESQTGNDINIQVKQQQHWFSFSNGSTSVAITVPSQANLDVSTGNGAVTLGAITGTLRAGTGNGRIEATGARGDVYLHTGNGRIGGSGLDGSFEARTGNGAVRVSGRFDGLQIDSGRGQVQATALSGSKMASDWRVGTGVGDVTVSLPSNFSAELSGSTGVGHVTVDFPVTVSGSLAGSSVRGRLGQGGRTLRVQTGVGSIHIERTTV